MPGDSSFHTAEGSSRKRLKISRDSGRPAGNPANSPEVVSLISSPAKRTILPAVAPSLQQNGHAKGTPCHHEHSLRSLHGDIDAMRGLITCKICDRFLYEPYSLTCGHTYCYSCLSSWMVDNKKKTCPDCRAVIKDQPVPSYVIRDMVHIFRSKSELLADGETSEEHVQLAKEEADIVLRDKTNTDGSTGGLFKGHFKKGGVHGHRLEALRDASDNVFRCPRCINEVEDGWCMHCHVRVATGEEGDDSDELFSDGSLELDHDLDEADEDDLGFILGEGLSDQSGYEDYHGHPELPLRYGFHEDGFPYELYSEDESEEEDDLTDGFIVDDTTLAEAASSDGESDGTERLVPAHRRPGRQAPTRPIVLSDDDEEEEHDDDENQRPAPRRRRLIAAFRRPNVRRVAAASTTGASQTSDSEEDDEDEEPVRAAPINSQRNRGHLATRTRRPILIESDEEPSDGETETTSRSVAGGFSPLAESDEEDSDGDTETASRPFAGGFSPLQSDEGFDDENDRSSRERSVSVTSGITDNSMEHDDDDDDEGMSDVSDDQNTTNNFDPRPYSHRLHTLGPRSARHADPATRGPCYQSFPPNRQAYNTNARLQASLHPSHLANRNIVPATAYPPTRPTGPPNEYPTHPFGLGSVLNRIQRNRQQTAAPFPPNPYVATSRRTGSNVSSQSSVGGGVDVRSHASGSSGSSHTVRAGADSGSGRRRRFREIDEEDEY